MIHNIDITDLNKITDRGYYQYREGGVEKMSRFKHVFVKMHDYEGRSPDGFDTMIKRLEELGYENIDPSFDDYLNTNEYFFHLNLSSFRCRPVVDDYKYKKSIIDGLERNGEDVFFMSFYTFILYDSEMDDRIIDSFGGIKVQSRYTNTTIATREY